MKNLLFIITALVMQPAMAADKTITCANEQCATNFSAQTVIEKPYYSAIDVGDNADNISVTVPTIQPPRSLRVNVKNGATAKNLTLNLSSLNPNANAGNAVVIGDLFQNLQINLNGYNGVRGKDASEICADNIKLGAYGADVQAFFKQRRDADPGLNPSRCDRIDLSYLQSYKFTCDDPTYVPQEGTSPLVEVERIASRARCSGILVRGNCLKRKVAVSCTYQSYNYWNDKGTTRTAWHNYYTTSTTILSEEYNSSEINRIGVAAYCFNNAPPTISPLHGGGWAYNSITTPLTSPGVKNINAQVLEPADGSLWEVYNTEAYQACPQYWTTIRTEYSSRISYDPTGTDCDASTVGIPEDPNNLIPWAYTGMAQEPEFGTELLQCAIGECPVSSTISDLTRELGTLTPESGSNGTQQGQGLAFIYDAASISTISTIGQGGAGGRNDLDAPESVRYCSKVRDAHSDGLTSNFAKTPTVSFRRYNWKALRSNSGGNAGITPQASSNDIQVYKKMDSSVRYLLSKELL